MPAIFKFKDLCEPGNVFDYDETFESDMREGRRYTVAWENIEAAGTVYPEHSTRAVDFILDTLGYLPFPTVYLPHEVGIRVLIAELDGGQITPAQFVEQATEHVRHIRNDDMLREGVIDHPMCSRAETYGYKDSLKEYAAVAKARITQLLGYKPVENNSLDAEILLRQCAANGQLSDTLADIRPHDCKAMTIVKFREQFVQKNGYTLALNSPVHDWKACRLQIK